MTLQLVRFTDTFRPLSGQIIKMINPTGIIPKGPRSI